MRSTKEDSLHPNGNAAFVNCFAGADCVELQARPAAGRRKTERITTKVWNHRTQELMALPLGNTWLEWWRRKCRPNFIRKRCGPRPLW